MSLTDTTSFPTGLDTFPDIAAGSDSLNSVGKEHDALHDKTSKAVAQLERINLGPTHVNVKAFGALGNGAANDSAAITAAYAAAADGAIMRFPVGEYMVDPAILAILASRRIEGDGQYMTWLKLRSDTAGAALDLNITGGGPSTRTQYGPQVKGIGINLGLAPSATGIKFRGNTAWVHVDDILIEGGAWSLDSQAPNCKVTNFHFLNPSGGFVKAVEAGLELRIYDGILEVSPAVTVPVLMDIGVLTGGIKGAVYLRDIACNNIGTVNRGIYVHCPNGSTASLPLRTTNVTLDNLAGPGIDLENVTDAQIMGGWLNSAAGTTNGAVRFYGGGAHTFMGVQQLNGGSGAACTYDFAGATPTGIVLLGNHPATATIYKLSATDKPANLVIQDRIANAATQAQVTNDVEGLRAAMSQLWTPGFQAQRNWIRESGTTPPAGYVVLAAGLATVAHAGVAANTRVRVWRERVGGTPGNLYSSVADNIVGTSFKIRSDNAADTSGVYWEMYDAV